MAERKKIGLLFSVSEGWIGGSYYFLNIIASLHLLPESDQPEVIIFANDTSGYEKAKETGYRYLSYLPATFNYSFLERGFNKLTRLLGLGNIIKKGPPEKELPILFGYYEQVSIHHVKRKVYWIPDFQEHYYPQFIGEAVSANRKKQHQRLIDENATIVFSSAAALADFRTIYGNSTNNCTCHIVRFAVTHPKYDHINYDDVAAKYLLPQQYYFTPNQFWPHKNHRLVLEAIAELVQAGERAHFVFSGKYNETDSHVKALFDFIDKNGLREFVTFVGFVSREEQLCIMQHAIAVVQPSLFEGWSTVVEDAKAMGKGLLLTDLPVHREQCQNYEATFFGINDAKELSSILIRNKNRTNKKIDFQYQAAVEAFAKDFKTACL